MEEYLRQLSPTNSADFSYEHPIGEAMHHLTIEGNNQLAPITVEAYVDSVAGNYLISSSVNQGSWWNSGEGDLFQKIFPGRKKLTDIN
jgi:hypothetical protein